MRFQLSTRKFLWAGRSINDTQVEQQFRRTVIYVSASPRPRLAIKPHHNENTDGLVDSCGRQLSEWEMAIINRNVR